MTATEQLDALLGCADADLAAVEADAIDLAADVAAGRAKLKIIRDNITRFIMENATQLVADAIAALQSDQAQAAADAKTIADLKAQNADLQARAVDPATLDALNTQLHPVTPPPAPPAA